MQSSLLSSAISFGPHVFNKPYAESSLFTKKNPHLLHEFVPPKKLVLTVSNKKQKPLIVKSSIKDSVKTSAVSVFQSLASFDTWVVQSLSNLIAFKPEANRLSSGLFIEGDLIQVKHKGKCIPLMVQHIGFLETTLTCIGGLIILHNHRIDEGSIKNLTIRVPATELETRGLDAEKVEAQAPLENYLTIKERLLLKLYELFDTAN